MVKATRRVKRVKRSKKQVHHGRRKTNRCRQRHTRRQRGGMFKGIAKFFATTKINNRGGPNYDGIEVFKVVVDGEQRYYIGNRTIDSYKQGSDDDRRYGELIESKLNGIPSNIAVGGQFDGVRYLTQENFTKFEHAFKDPAAASGAAERVSQNDQIRLERMRGVQNQMKLYFVGVEHILSLNQPLEIQIQPNPKSKQNPITKLIFMATEVNMKPEVTFEIVLKNDDMSRCAMQLYEQECQMYGRHDEFNEKKLSIKNNIMLSGFFSKNIISIGDDIIPLMDKLVQFTNVCESESLEGKIGSMSVRTRQ